MLVRSHGSVISCFARFIGAGLVVAAPLFAADAMGQSSVRAAAEPSPMPLASFYLRASSLAPAGRLGEVLLREDVPTSIPNAQAWRIAYISSDLRDRPTINTAIVVAPRGDMPAEGRPIISWGHGTTGTAQGCGPSQVADPARNLNQYVLPDGDSWTDYGIPALDTFIARGHVVVATDYQGLGGGGDHQYSVAVTNARDTVDAVRSAGAMGFAGNSRSAIIYGWSQGGGAAIAAASMRDYLNKRGTAFDGIDLRGVVALAPQDVAAMLPRVQLDDADAARIIQGIGLSFSDNIFNFAHFTMTLWATVASTPGLQMSDIFTDLGARELDHLLRRKCMHVLSDTMSFVYGANYRTLLRAAPVNGAAWVQALLAGSVPPVRPVAPVAIYFGSAAVTVPPAMGAAYRGQMCAMGGNVARTQLLGAQSHFTTPGASQAMYLEWVADRLAGRPAANGCSD